MLTVGVSNGVAQGAILSPKLVYLYMDDLSVALPETKTAYNLITVY